MLATLKEIVGEDIASKMDALDLRHEGDGVGATQSNLDREVEVYGRAYKDLAEFVKKEEDKIAGKTAHVVGRTVRTDGRSFERDVVYASRAESSTGEVELAWVCRNNKKAWETAVGFRPTP